MFALGALPNKRPIAGKRLLGVVQCCRRCRLEFVARPLLGFTYSSYERPQFHRLGFGGCALGALRYRLGRQRIRVRFMTSAKLASGRKKTSIGSRSAKCSSQCHEVVDTLNTPMSAVLCA